MKRHFWSTENVKRRICPPLDRVNPKVWRQREKGKNFAFLLPSLNSSGYFLSKNGGQQPITILVDNKKKEQSKQQWLNWKKINGHSIFFFCIQIQHKLLLFSFSPQPSCVSFLSMHPRAGNAIFYHQNWDISDHTINYYTTKGAKSSSFIAANDMKT